MNHPVLVTGATGNIGSRVAAGLREAGVRARLATIDPVPASDAAPAVAGADEWVRFNYTDPATWDAAFDGVKTAFIVRPPDLSNIKRDMVPALEAARAAGVEHMVLLSLQGAESNSIVPHAKIEAWILASGLRYTFVRPSFFMENLSGTHVTDVRDRDRIVVPAGTGRTSFVSAADVAAVAVVALANPAAHLDRAWTPTGSEALTYGEFAEILSRALGRDITYANPGIVRYASHARRVLGMPWGMVAVTTAIYTIARLGKASGMTDDVQEVTGRAPMTVEQWVDDNLAVWKRAGPAS